MRPARLAALLLCTGLFACSGILGIDDRELVATTADELSCATYCDAALEGCTGDFALYASVEACLGTCAKMPLGTADDTTGNTVGCRLTSARLAKQTGEFGDYCPPAGPGGDDRCGSNCDGFCTVMLAYCADVYEDMPACQTACAGVTDLHAYSINQGLGATLDCRLYHATSATLDAVHCDHAAGLAKCVEATGGGGSGGGT